MNLRKHETSLPTYATIHIHTEYHPCHYRLSLVKLSTNQKAVHFFSVPHKNILNISPAVEYFEKPRLHIRNFESKFNFVPLCADPTNSTTDALPVLRIKAPYATMRISVVRVGWQVNIHIQRLPRNFQHAWCRQHQEPRLVPSSQRTYITYVIYSIRANLSPVYIRVCVCVCVWLTWKVWYCVTRYMGHYYTLGWLPT